jgi:predicted MFS family arabinose efflux permease
LTGFLTGQSIGASLAGMLIDASGPRMALFATTASLALAAVAAISRWATFARTEQVELDHKRGRGQGR